MNKASLLLLGTLLPLGGCGDSCENRWVQEHVNADHKVVIFQRSCGATTGYSTHVSLLKPAQDARGTGNVFIADDNRGRAQPTYWGGPWVSVQWTKDGLLIRHDKEARIFKAEERLGTTNIWFEPADRPNMELKRE
jgi:hypothetical protein